MNLNEIQSLVFEEYIINGYFDLMELSELIKAISKLNYPEIYPSDFGFDNLKRMADIAEVGMINTEVSELLESIFKGEIEKYGSELSDIIIRTMNFASRKGIKLEREILSKNEKNLKRGKLHGKWKK